MKMIDKLHYILYFPISTFYKMFHHKLKVISKEDTISLLKEKSIARYGDGELSLMLGTSIKFQKKDKILQKRLIQIASSNNPNCLIAIPPIFTKKDINYLDVKTKKWWKKNLFITKGLWYKYFKNKIYGNSFISRYYLEYLDKSDESIKNYIKLIRNVWKQKNIIFVEGEKSRLGVGNDLFSNAKSIKRILCPSTNAFSKYEKIYDSVLLNSTNDDLIICALGPTATVLAYDLSKIGRHVLDLGHIDVEYEWYKLKANEPVNIIGKDVSESGESFIDSNEMVPENVISVVS